MSGRGRDSEGRWLVPGKGGGSSGGLTRSTRLNGNVERHREQYLQVKLALKLSQASGAFLSLASNLTIYQ